MKFLAVLERIRLLRSHNLLIREVRVRWLLAAAVFVPPPESCIDDVQAYLHIVRASVLMGWDTVFWSLDLDLHIFRTAGEDLTGCYQTPCITNMPCGFAVRFALRTCCVRLFFWTDLGIR